MMKSVTLRLLLLLLFFLASGCIPTYRLTDAEVFGPPNHQLPQITMDKQSGDIDRLFDLRMLKAKLDLGLPAGRPESLAYRVVHGNPDLEGVPSEYRGLVAAA